MTAQPKTVRQFLDSVLDRPVRVGNLPQICGIVPPQQGDNVIGQIEDEQRQLVMAMFAGFRQIAAARLEIIDDGDGTNRIFAEAQIKLSNRKVALINELLGVSLSLAVGPDHVGSAIVRTDGSIVLMPPAPFASIFDVATGRLTHLTASGTPAE